MATKEENEKQSASIKNNGESDSLEIIILEDIEVNSMFKTNKQVMKDIFIRASLCCSSEHEIPECILKEKDENKLMMIAGSHYIPKKTLGAMSGQDAHFVRYDDKGRATIGVADGVGGWLRVQIDSGVHARELMENAMFSIDQNPSLTGVTLLKKMLHDAWLMTKAEGASTACFLTLGDDDFLHATNVGDSGFMVIREEDDGKTTVYKSRVQTINDVPYQLGKASNTRFTPEDAQDTIFQVKDGDIVVLATDGLFDNVLPREIVGIIEACRSLNNGVLPPANVVAGVITKVALLLSASRKPDDITVVVGYIGNNAFMKGLSGEPESDHHCSLGSMANMNHSVWHTFGCLRSWILPFFNQLVGI